MTINVLRLEQVFRIGQEIEKPAMSWAVNECVWDMTGAVLATVAYAGFELQLCI